ncbi:hypothetical protein ACJX0J_035690, partial [Zea mays]
SMYNVAKVWQVGAVTREYMIIFIYNIEIRLMRLDMELLSLDTLGIERIKIFLGKCASGNDLCMFSGGPPNVRVGVLLYCYDIWTKEELNCYGGSGTASNTAISWIDRDECFMKILKEMSKLDF